MYCVTSVSLVSLLSAHKLMPLFTPDSLLEQRVLDEDSTGRPGVTGVALLPWPPLFGVGGAGQREAHRPAGRLAVGVTEVEERAGRQEGVVHIPVGLQSRQQAGIHRLDLIR